MAKAKLSTAMRNQADLLAKAEKLNKQIEAIKLASLKLFSESITSYWGNEALSFYEFSKSYMDKFAERTKSIFEDVLMEMTNNDDTNSENEDNDNSGSSNIETASASNNTSSSISYHGEASSISKNQ